MRDKMKTGGKLFLIWALGILLGGVCLQRAGIMVCAEEASFVIQAELLPTGKATCDIRCSVENLGADWEGTVRLMVDADYYRDPVAYDTILSLPQGSRKQFVVKVPQNVGGADGTVRVALLDKKSNKLAEKEFWRLLKEEMMALSMGILSDDYAALTYLDMGGGEFYFHADDYPIRLVELNQDNLSEALDRLTFLVIDRYNTGILTDEETKAIELWVDNGGVLIIGTGSYAEDTLQGFDSLGIRCGRLYEPEEGVKGYHVDFSQLGLVELSGSGFDTSSGSLAMVCSRGYGAIGILPYALSDLGGLDASAFWYDQETFVKECLGDVSSAASTRYMGYDSDSDNSYMLGRILGILGNSNSLLHFGALKSIVILYVIFVGPVLYLILRFTKKRELYWAAVPVAALFTILFVFWAGRGFEVARTRVYSVTVENVSGRGGSRTYLHCYDANHREWSLRLSEGYDYIGPLTAGSRNYGETADYYYHVRKEGDRLSFGINPNIGFEDCYFMCGGAGQAVSGSIVTDGVLSLAWPGVRGTVTNGTDRDFRYFAVIADGIVYVHGSLPAGESCDLQTAETIYTSSQSWRNSLSHAYLYDFLDDVYQDGRKSDVSAMAALGVGISSVYNDDMDTIVIIGVTEDWDKTVDDNCSEISYGCLYTVQ